AHAAAALRHRRRAAALRRPQSARRARRRPRAASVRGLARRAASVPRARRRAGVLRRSRARGRPGRRLRRLVRGGPPRPRRVAARRRRRPADAAARRGTMTARMRLFVAIAAPALVLAAAAARAQEPPPRIGPFVVDLHATVPRFPSDDSQLARSRGMDLSELPGTGLGIQAGAHIYLLRVKAITFGLGAEFAASRSRQTPQEGAISATTGQLLRPSEERFSTVSPQLSFNFGNGNGWSYLSGGLGVSNWAV